MRIVSLNAWGGQCWPVLGPWLTTTAPDILCLQEVTRATAPAPSWLRYSDDERDLDQRSDLLVDVSDCLPGHRAHFAPAARGWLQAADGAAHRSEFGLGQWIARPLALIGAWQGMIHGHFGADGFGDDPPRALQIIRLHTARGPLVVAHLHGLRDPSGKHDTPARHAQTRAVLAALDGCATPAMP